MTIACLIMSIAIHEVWITYVLSETQSFALHAMNLPANAFVDLREPVHCNRLHRHFVALP